MRPFSSHKTRQTLLRTLSQGWEKRILIASIGIPIVIELRRAALAEDAVLGDYILLPAGVALLLKKPQAFLITWAIIETTFLALDINQQFREPAKPVPRWDVHFGEIYDDRKDSTAPHITFRPQLGGHR